MYLLDSRLGVAKCAVTCNRLCFFFTVCTVSPNAFYKATKPNLMQFASCFIDMRSDRIFPSFHALLSLL